MNIIYVVCPYKKIELYMQCISNYSLKSIYIEKC